MRGILEVLSMGSMTINKVIEDFSILPLDEKEYALKIIEKQLIEAKRDAIAKRALKAMTAFKKGAAKKGTARDLYKDIELD